MLWYGKVLIDIDLSIGRQYGYNNPLSIARHPSRSETFTARYGTPARCHPERENRGYGLCGSCYNFLYRGRKKEAEAAAA